MTPEQREAERKRKRICTPARIAAQHRYLARLRAPAEARQRKLGKLLNLSVHGATEAERSLARSKYHSLKARTIA